MSCKTINSRSSSSKWTRASMLLSLLLASWVSGTHAFSLHPIPRILGTDGRRISAVSLSSAFASSLLMSTPETSSGDKKGVSIRRNLRKITGFSLTAIRATLRAATGISLTAIYASSLAATGVWIRQTMKVVLSIFPPWFRYFLQPFLVLYYAPLFILRNLTGPRRKEAFQTHEHFVEGWKSAIDKADETTAHHWSLKVGDDGFIEKVQDVDVNEAIN